MLVKMSADGEKFSSFEWTLIGFSVHSCNSPIRTLTGCTVLWSVATLSLICVGEHIIMLKVELFHDNLPFLLWYTSLLLSVPQSQKKQILPMMLRVGGCCHLWVTIKLLMGPMNQNSDDGTVNVTIHIYHENTRFDKVLSPTELIILAYTVHHVPFCNPVAQGQTLIAQYWKSFLLHHLCRAVTERPPELIENASSSYMIM